jgi:hypothetical protein
VVAGNVQFRFVTAVGFGDGRRWEIILFPEVERDGRSFYSRRLKEMRDHSLLGGWRRCEIINFPEVGEDGRSFSSRRLKKLEDH